VSRARWQLRDAALGYGSRGIPVLPFHYTVPHRGGLQPVGGDHDPAMRRTGCSCRDPGCGQVGKHPLGSLVPHGVKDATTNRARILAWWTRHPQANIGLATGHRFDVLDVDGPEVSRPSGPWRLSIAWRVRVRWSAPAEAAGTITWPPPASATSTQRGLAHVDWRGWGGYVVAPPSRHATGHPYQWALGRDVDTPPGQVPAVLLERLQPRQLRRPTSPVQLPAAADGSGDRYARAALAEELARVATARRGERNRQLWESTRNLYNLVAAGALDQRGACQPR
jgi:Bifunctional DNA primase/polymerase, N-terminal